MMLLLFMNKKYMTMTLPFEFTTSSNDDNYHFIGWYVNDELVSTDLTYSFQVSENKTFEAKWSGKPYQISLEVNEGQNLENQFNISFDITMIMSYLCQIQEGYSFIGWYTGKDNGDSFNNSGVFKLDEI